MEYPLRKLHSSTLLCDTGVVGLSTNVLESLLFRRIGFGGLLQNQYPFVYFISYFNPKIGLTGSEDFSRPLYEILERDYHAIAKVSKEDISARLADKYIANKLEIKVGDPILVRKRFVYDPDGCPLEWNIGYYRADSFTYSLEFERNI